MALPEDPMGAKSVREYLVATLYGHVGGTQILGLRELMGLPMDLRGPVLVRGYDSVGSSLFERGTKSGLSTGAVQGRVGLGVSALAWPR